MLAIISVFAFDLFISDFLLGIFSGWEYIFHRVEFYTEFAEQQELEFGFITTALIIRIFFFFYLLYERASFTDKYFPYLLNVYFLSIVVYKVFAFIPELATRGSVYFTLVEPILLTNYLFSCKKRKLAYIFCIVVLLLSMYRQGRSWEKMGSFKYELVNIL